MLVGLVVIWATFQILNPTFLSSTNLVNLTMQCAAVGTMAIGIVLVLLIGEIDLSVGSVSGLASAILAVAFVQNGLPLIVAILMAIAAGAVAGLIFGLLRTAFGVPSFVITLAGLLGFLGRAALRARRARVDQHPVRVGDRAVRAAVVPARLGVVRRRRRSPC